MKLMLLNSIRKLTRGNHSSPGVATSLSLNNAQARTVMQTTTAALLAKRLTRFETATHGVRAVPTRAVSSIVETS
jgi:hypothetical protein